MNDSVDAEIGQQFKEEEIVDDNLDEHPRLDVTGGLGDIHLSDDDADDVSYSNDVYSQLVLRRSRKISTPFLILRKSHLADVGMRHALV